MRPKARFLMAFPLPLPKHCKGHGKRKQEGPCGDYRLLPRVTKPATVLAAIKDKPFRWPPSGWPSLTAARHGGAIEPRSGRKNGPPAYGQTLADSRLQDSSISSKTAQAGGNRHLRPDETAT